MASTGTATVWGAIRKRSGRPAKEKRTDHRQTYGWMLASALDPVPGGHGPGRPEGGLSPFLARPGPGEQLIEGPGRLGLQGGKDVGLGVHGMIPTRRGPGVGTGLRPVLVDTLRLGEIRRKVVHVGGRTRP